MRRNDVDMCGKVGLIKKAASCELRAASKGQWMYD